MSPPRLHSLDHVVAAASRWWQRHGRRCQLARWLMLTGWAEDDLYSEVMLAMVESARHPRCAWDPARGTAQTYVAMVARQRLSKLRRRRIDVPTETGDAAAVAWQTGTRRHRLGDAGARERVWAWLQEQHEPVAVQDMPAKLRRMGTYYTATEALIDLAHEERAANVGTVDAPLWVSLDGGWLEERVSLGMAEARPAGGGEVGAAGRKGRVDRWGLCDREEGGLEPLSSPRSRAVSGKNPAFDRRPDRRGGG